MSKEVENNKLSELLNPRRNMDSKFRSLLFEKISEYCTSNNELDFFEWINSKVKGTYYLIDFLDNYTRALDRISNILKTNEWYKLERSEILDFLRRSNSIKENEIYVILLAIDLSTFKINGNWQYSTIDINSYYPYVIVLAAELNIRLSDYNKSLSSIVDDIKPLVTFYKKERLLEFFLEHFNSIDWYISSTIRLSREFLRYSKVNSKYLFYQKITEKSYIDNSDIIIMQDEMLAMLISRIRELFLTKSDERHSSAFSYIIKITNLVDIKFKKKHFNKMLQSILDCYKDELEIYSIKRNKENFHITTYKPATVFRGSVIQSETTLSIPKVYEILDTFINLYEDYRQIIIKGLSLSRPSLPNRAKIKKGKLGDLYLKYTYE